MPQRRPPASRAGGREIEVEVSGDEGSAPKAFTLGSHRHLVAEVVSTWHDESFSGPARRGDAWLGHERLFYRVRTEAGELFDVYFDLGERRRHGRGRWVLHRRLTPAEAPLPEQPRESEAAAPPAEKAATEKPASPN